MPFRPLIWHKDPFRTLNGRIIFVMSSYGRRLILMLGVEKWISEPFFKTWVILKNKYSNDYEFCVKWHVFYQGTYHLSHK